MLSIRIKCPYHPRYNPMIGGEGAIVAGCRYCGAIYKYFLEGTRLLRDVDEALHTENEEDMA